MLDLQQLVDRENGQVSRRVYVDRDIYEQELEQVFARCWCFLAHESQVPNPGDFIASYIGEDPVLVVRDSRGKVNAFLNTCRHRGMRVCRADEGNAAAFTCTYHGWTYGNDGKLVGVPGYKEYYYEELDMEQWGLVPVAQVESYHGFVFGTFDAKAPPLREYLGDLTWYFDFLFDRREGGVEFISGVHKWVMDCNWKFGADNFIGDGYHVPVSHISARKAGFGGSPQRLASQATRQGASYSVNVQYGHAFTVQQQTIAQAEATPEFEAYSEAHIEEAESRLGPRVRGWAPGISTLFPNISFLPVRRNIRVWHPRGPNKTEIWNYVYVDKQTPPELKEIMKLYCSRAFGPAGAFEMDDGENWKECTYSNSGYMARQYTMNYQIGLGREEFHEELPGWVLKGTNEHNQRGFYEHWSEMMSARSWSDVENKFPKLRKSQKR